MFENVGKKIKLLAKVCFWIDVVAVVIWSLILIESTEGASLLLAACIILVVLVSAWFLYGFGEIIDHLAQIERNTRSVVQKSETQTNNDLKRISQIEELRAKGLISEEEYQRITSKNT